MARLTFPDEGSRSSFRTAPNGRPLTSAAGAAALVYLDAGATTLADIQTTAGVAIAGSSLNLDAYSRFPLFLGPADGTDTLYVVVDGGPVSPMYARVDDRIDAVKATADAAETPAGAQAKATAAQAAAVQRANHTGTQSADTLTDGTTNKAFLATERTKLSGVATGATANSADATLLARANHTGTQLAATVSDFSTAVVTAASGAYRTAAQCLAPGANPLGDAVELAAKIAAAGTGGTVALAPGGYDCPNGLTVSAPVTIVGHGGLFQHDAGTSPPVTGSSIRVSSATATGLSVSGSGVTLLDVAVVCTATTPTAGAGITWASANSFAMSRVTVSGFYDCMTVDNGWFYKVSDCNFFDPVRYGILQTSTVTAYKDHADAGFTNCVVAMMTRQTDAAAAVRWEGGGGFRWTSCKIVGQGEPGSAAFGSTGTWLVGVDLAPADGVATVEASIIGGGVSNCKTANVRAAPKTSTGTLSRLTVQGAAIQAWGGAQTCVGISVNAAISNVVINGNTFASQGGGSIWVQQTSGIDIGPNMHLGVTGPLVRISGPSDTGGVNTRSVKVAVQTLGTSGGNLPTNLTILQDDRAVLSTNNSNGGAVDLRYTFGLSSTSVGTWVTVCSYKVVPGIGAAHGSARLVVDIDGHSSGVGAFGGKYERSAFADAVGSAVTTATIGTDATWGGGAANVAFRLDTATTPGTVLVQYQLVTPGANIGGRMSVDLRGIVSWFALGTGG